MPTDPEETLRDGIYPDDLRQMDRIILHDRYAEGFWNADDDDDAQDLPDDCGHGWWIPISSGGPSDEPRWLSAPEELRTWLVRKDLDPGDRFRVKSIERGPEDHDPYEMEIEEI